MNWRDKLDDDALESLLDDAEDQAPSKADVIRSRLLSTDDLQAIPRPAPLIDGWLYLDSLAMLYGPSGGGKSFVMVDAAMSIGTGQSWWHHNAVTPGPVLYVIAEGAAGIGLRTDAWQAHHEPTAPPQVTWLPTAINIYDAAWADALAEVVADLRPVLVIIDTFARSIIGADENSSRDIGQAVANLDRIRHAAGSCVLIVHHSGKNPEAGGRGSSALKAAMDTEIELTGDASRIVARNTKQKNAVAASPLWLRLQSEADSAVVVTTSANDPDELPAGVLDTLETLRSIEVPGGISSKAWQMAAEASERTFYRHRAALLRHAMVANIGTEKQPRYQVVCTDDE